MICICYFVNGILKTVDVKFLWTFFQYTVTACRVCHGLCILYIMVNLK